MPINYILCASILVNKLCLLIQSIPYTWFIQLQLFITQFYNLSFIKGNVKASFTVIDPEDLGSFEASPGDFSMTDESGNIQQLETLGMYAVINNHILID